MREIKFRVWDKMENKMRNLNDTHDTIMFSPSDEGKAHYYNLQNGDGNSFDDSGYGELMQYTGLKDKNGVEIYEGDIVTVDCYDHYEPSSNYYGEVIMGGLIGLGLHDFETNETYDMYECQGEYKTFYEVIGNIYENKELLDVGDEIEHFEKNKQ